MGTSITINDLDLVTLQQLESEARRRGIDVSTLAREMLQRAAVPAPPDRATPQVHHDLDSLAGTWSEADAQAFEAATAGFGRPDPELWK